MVGAVPDCTCPQWRSCPDVLCHHLRIMTSTRPYLLRAFYQWIVDNAMTPHLLVDAQAEGVHVPQQYVANGKIVLNVSPSAVRMLEMENDHVTFSARFGGSPLQISVPMRAVTAIYAKENGKGMVFPEDEPDGEPPPGPGPDDGASRKPALKLVK